MLHKKDGKWRETFFCNNGVKKMAKGHENLTAG
jgi:hypothetical protein